MMLTQKKYLRLIFLAFIASKSYGSDITFLKTCRSDVYDRLVQENKVFTAIALKISGHPPQECLAKYERLKRFIALEDPNYFPSTIDDRKYRASINATLVDEKNDKAPTSMYSNLSINKSTTALDTNDKPRIQVKVVTGYGVLKGSE